MGEEGYNELSFDIKGSDKTAYDRVEIKSDNDETSAYFIKDISSLAEIYYHDDKYIRSLLPIALKKIQDEFNDYCFLTLPQAHDETLSLRGTHHIYTLIPFLFSRFGDDHLPEHFQRVIQVYSESINLK